MWGTHDEFTWGWVTLSYTHWVEIRRPHGTCGTLLWLLRSISVQIYKCGRIRPKYSVTKTRFQTKSLDINIFMISPANWYSWDDDVLLQSAVFTPCVQHSLSPRQPHTSQMMTHLRHTGSLLYFVLQITVSLPSSGLILSIRPNHVFTP